MCFYIMITGDIKQLQLPRQINKHTHVSVSSAHVTGPLGISTWLIGANLCNRFLNISFSSSAAILYQRLII